MNMLGKRTSRPPLANYDAARARAIEWLGDRYLLATPIRLRRGSGETPHVPGGAGGLTTQPVI